MLRGIPVLKTKMNLKASKRGFKKKNLNPTDYVHCCIIDCHVNSLLHLV